MDSKQKTGRAGDVEEIKSSGARRKAPSNLIPIIFGGVSIIILLALALGLGLGLGLRKKGSSESSSPADLGEDSLSSSNIKPWREATKDYLLDFSNWDLNAPPTTRTYNFTIAQAQIAPDGVNKTVLTINGQFPGPLIRINRGDRLLVNLTNNLPDPTTLHWHGMFQNGTNWMDGTTGVTQCPVPPGKSFLYNFTVPNQYGTYWYHAHYSTQYVDGINGPLIIHAPEEAQARQRYDYDQVIMLQDWYHDTASELVEPYLASGNENAEPVPDNGLFQGTNYFNCSSLDPDSGYQCSNDSARPIFAYENGKRYRLRFINSGAFTQFQISVDNHTLEIIEADGTTTQPYPIHRFEIGTAERYSAILTLNQSTSTNYWIRTSMNTNCYAGDNDNLDPNMLGLLTYTNSSAAPTNSVDWGDAYDIICQDLNNTLLKPSVAEQPPPADVLYELQFSFSIRDYAMDRGYINGTTWYPNVQMPTLMQAVNGLKSSNTSASFQTSGVVNGAYSANQYVIGLPSQQRVIDLVIMNFDDGSHPFHLHGHEFWVMATSESLYFPWDTDLYGKINSTEANEYTTNPMKRDTLVIPNYSWALIRFRNDVPGQWVFHCHNLWHMEAGLLMQFLAHPEVVKDWTLPTDVTNLCTS